MKLREGVTMIPKVKFKKMTLEENVSLVKWMLFNKDVGFNMQEATLGYFPDLKDKILLILCSEVKYGKSCIVINGYCLYGSVTAYDLR